MTQISRSTRQATPVPGGVQKRRTLLISDRDPRNNPSYIANYIGEVKVLPYAEYLQYIKTTTYAEPSDGNPTDASTGGTVVSTLHPPTNLYWDATVGSAATEIIPSGTSHTINLYVTFDPSTDDVATDGTITYEVRATATGPAITSATVANGGGSSTNNSGTKITPSTTSTSAPVVLSTISTLVHTSGEIQIRWKGVSGVSGYDVVVTGPNQANAAGKASKAYVTGKDVGAKGTANAGYHVFTIYPQSPAVFHGTYTFSISAKYTTTTSKAVSYNVTV